jgi:hypothetical protein
VGRPSSLRRSSAEASHRDKARFAARRRTGRRDPAHSGRRLWGKIVWWPGAIATWCLWRHVALPMTDTRSSTRRRWTLRSPRLSTALPSLRLIETAFGYSTSRAAPGPSSSGDAHLPAAGAARRVINGPGSSLGRWLSGLGRLRSPVGYRRHAGLPTHRQATRTPPRQSPVPPVHTAARTPRSCRLRRVRTPRARWRTP